MRKLTVLTLLIVLLFSGGCWDNRPINELALIFGIGIDQMETEHELKLFTFVNPVFDPQAENIRTTNSIAGYSLQQALVNLQHQIEQLPVMGKLDVLVFSEETARDGSMHTIISQYNQMRDSHPTAWICVIRESEAREVLKLNMPQQPRASIFLADMFQENMANGRLPRSDLFTYLQKHYTAGITAVAPLIELTGADDKKTGILLAGVAAFDAAGNMKGHLSDAETLMFMLLTGKINRGQFSTRVNIGQEENRLVTAFIQSDSVKVKTKIIDDKPIIQIKVTIAVNGLHADIKETLFSADLLQQLEKALARDLQGNMLKVIRKCQEWKADIFGFGRFIRINHNQWFKENNWETGFKNSEIQLEVNVKIKRFGALQDPTF